MSRPDYDAIKTSSNPQLKIMTGTNLERLNGLSRVFDFAAGKMVLDIACHNGTLAGACAAAGAIAIDGVDIWRPGLAMAVVELANYPIPSRFAYCDLTGGIAALHLALEPMAAHHDVVLYLGIHQHLARQIESETLDQLLWDIAVLAKSVIAMRMPAGPMVRADAVVRAAGFDLWYEDSSSDIVGPLRVYRRLSRPDNLPYPQELP